MIDVNCYNCGSDQNSFYASENGFILVKCSDCGLLYVTPRPRNDEIHRAHQYGIHQGESALNMTGAYSVARSRAYRNILKDLYKTELTQERRTWLDIGCGHGEFLTALIEFSDQVRAKGLEPNVHKQESAQSRGLDVTYFDIKSHKQKYDVVSLLNVYSHLPNPPEFFASCRNLLNSGGELLLQTGDAAHLSADEMYRPMLLPDHLSFASKEIVSSILKRCGFGIVTVCKYPVVPFSLIRIIKEFAKFALPNRTCAFKYVLNPKYRTDMYIRAIVTSDQEVSSRKEE